MNIQPNRNYALKEVLAERLIPNVTGYSALYKLVTVTQPNNSKKLGVSRKLAKETTHEKIKAESINNPWNTISGKITVKGSEVLKFLKINKLI